MEREQTTIRLPAELKEKLQQEADKREIIIFMQAIRVSDTQGLYP